MNSHDLPYIFLIMAIKMICQIGAQFSIFYSHLPFPNHFHNFKLITFLTSLFHIFTATLFHQIQTIYLF